MSTAIPDNIPYTSPLFTDTIVPIIIGVYLAFILFGIGLLQFYHAFSLLQQSTANEKWNYLLLCTFLVLDTADQIAKAVFFVDNQRGVAVHGVAAGFLPTPPSVAAFVGIGSLIPLVTHFYYIKRIHRISRKWQYRHIVWVILIICGLTSCMTIVFAAISAKIGLRPAVEYFPDIKVFPIPWLAGEAGVDIVLCITLSVYLLSQRTDFNHTNDLLTKWINLTVETGLFPAVVALTDVILGVRFPEKTYHFAANLVVTKAYINSALVLFSNVQQGRLKDQMSSQTGSGTTKGPRYIGSRFVPGTHSGAVNSGLNSGIVVKSQIETMHDQDHAVAMPVNLQMHQDDYHDKYYGIDLEKGRRPSGTMH